MELRWAKRRTAKVLQWREVAEWVGSDDITKPLQPKYSEWQDIKTEDADSVQFSCACRFGRSSEFSEATLLEPCGFHAPMMSLLREARRFLNAQAYTQEEMEDFCKRLDDYLGLPTHQ